jgi:hypothetical protein
MELIKVILIYILAFFIVAFFGNIFILLFIPLGSLMRKIKSIMPIISAVLDIASNFIAVFIIVLLCDKLNIKPTLLMVIIPGVLTIQNNTSRIKRAKKGIANVKYMFERSGESDSYEQELDVRNEYAHLIGDVTGLLLGTIYFLSNAPLF